MTDRHDIMWFDTLDSTNEEVRRQIDNLDNLSVVSALTQTSGRGQRGNSWTSAPGQNLTFSILLKFADDTSNNFHSSLPHLKAVDQFVISEVAAISVAKLLDNHGISASIKWPNDIYAGNRKICGILVENILRRNNVSRSIIGIGLNINQKNFDVSLPNPTSMLLETVKHKCFTDCGSYNYDIYCLLEEFLDIFADYCRLFLSSDTRYSELRDLYLSRLWRLNTPASFRDLTVLPKGHSLAPVVTGKEITEGREFTGIIRGLSPIGSLLIEDIKANSIMEFAFKEISYIL